MTPTPSIFDLDDDLLEELYDEGSLERGTGYAADGRVHLVETTPGLVRSVCEGSARATYLVQIRWHASGGGVSLDDVCSCPLGGQCKHCVATILTARRQANVVALRDPRTAEASTPGPPSPPGLRPMPDWRTHLRGLEPSDAVAPERQPLALQFSISWPKNRWAQDHGPRLTIRPMRRGQKGRWIKGDAAWRDLVSPYPRSYGPGSNIDQVHRTAVAALAASAKIGPYTTGPDPTLDRFGADVWALLDRAVETGVALIGDRANVMVELERHPAEVVVDLSSDDHGTAVVTASLLVGGGPVERLGEEVHLLGTPPHGLWAATSDLVRLIAFESPLHPTVAALLELGVLAVPERDVDELLDRYVPALGQHATVASSDGSLVPEVNRFEAIVLVVTRTAPDEARLSWWARYRRGDRVSDHPLDRSAGLGRDHEAEADARAGLELPELLQRVLPDAPHLLPTVLLSGMDVIDLFETAIPSLEAPGTVVVEVHSTLPALRAATSEPVISVRLDEATPGRDGTDWFDLGITVTVDGEEIDFVSLFTALHRGDPVLVLPSGTWVSLDRPDFAKLRDLLDEANGLADPAGSATARVNPFQVSWWDELVKLGVVAEQSERWTARVQQLAELQAPSAVAAPATLQATLRPYQQEGLDWLAFLHRSGLGGILADDMGLGKTVQTLALCLHIHGERPTSRFLVVAPTSVVENWAREAARFAPTLPVRTIRETQARRGTSLEEEIGDAAVVVTSYALFRIEFEQYAALDWELLLLDEAQFVKNHQGKTHQCARRLDAATKIAITGTPLENSLMDLWSLLSITAPGLYPDPQRFSATYRKPIEAGSAPELLATLRRRIAPLMRRRTKDAVLTELPPKIEQTIPVELSPKHERVYAAQLQRQRQKVLGLVGDVTRHRFEILKSLTILRQMALDPSLVDEVHDGIGSAKLDRLVDDLTQVLAEGHRALVFSQFTRYLARVRARLDEAGIAHTYLDGRTRKRDEAIARFTDGEVPVFVISLKAGGFGLNLTQADYCFVLDPWWNPATETQAVDRAHRIGQDRPVVVYRYVSTDTIEEKVMELKAQKAGLFDRVVGDDAALAGALSERDIRGLLDLA